MGVRFKKKALLGMLPTISKPLTHRCLSKQIATTCLQRPQFWCPTLHVQSIKIPRNNDHLSITATILGSLCLSLLTRHAIQLITYHLACCSDFVAQYLWTCVWWHPKMDPQRMNCPQKIPKVVFREKGDGSQLAHSMRWVTTPTSQTLKKKV